MMNPTVPEHFESVNSKYIFKVGQMLDAMPGFVTK